MAPQSEAPCAGIDDISVTDQGRRSWPFSILSLCDVLFGTKDCDDWLYLPARSIPFVLMSEMDVAGEIRSKKRDLGSFYLGTPGHRTGMLYETVFVCFVYSVQTIGLKEVRGKADFNTAATSMQTYGTNQITASLLG